MKLRILSVYDRAAQAYARPMFLPSAGVGIRSFSDEVNRIDSENNFYHHSEDYELFDLGEFDDHNASFYLLEFPKCLARAMDLKISN